MKKVCLCIPLYNGETTIAATLDSLLAQTYPASKIKIFDNQSTDRSVEIVKNIAQKNPTIELIINEKNVGAEGNFTLCLQAAEGDYCAIVHADDIYHQDYIKRSVESLDNKPDAVASFCHANEIDGEGMIIGERFKPHELLQESKLNLQNLKKLVYRYGNFITCPSVMARSDIYREKIKTWNGQQYKSSADLDVWMRLASLGALIAIPEPLINYRVAEASHSFRIAKKRITKHDLFLVLDQYRDSAVEDDYKFLMLKDQALRSLNIIRNKQSNPYPVEQPFDLILVLRKMFQSKWHLKFGVSILGIKLLTLLKRQPA